ncbi:MAG: Holliday junction branch migration protein RuvA [Bacteroidota bacterium]
MINHIKGELLEKTPTYVIIDCSGVGYFINISLHTYSQLPDPGNCKLYTHLVVREDSHTLYGFAGQQERQLFRHLISVSGVGTNTARVVLSSMSPDEISQAIITKDAAKLQSIKGIGGKTAERIIIDLKDRLEKEGIIAEVDSPVSGTNRKIRDDALSALLMLGFAKKSAEKVIDQALRSESSELSLEQLIKITLGRL